jgi:hypothetical protein
MDIWDMTISSMMMDGLGDKLFLMEMGGPMYANDIYILDVDGWAGGI